MEHVISENSFRHLKQKYGQKEIVAGGEAG